MPTPANARSSRADRYTSRSPLASWISIHSPCAVSSTAMPTVVAASHGRSRLWCWSRPLCCPWLCCLRGLLMMGASFALVALLVVLVGGWCLATPRSSTPADAATGGAFTLALALALVGVVMANGPRPRPRHRTPPARSCWPPVRQGLRPLAAAPPATPTPTTPHRPASRPAAAPAPPP